MHKSAWFFVVVVGLLGCRRPSDSGLDESTSGPTEGPSESDSTSESTTSDSGSSESTESTDGETDTDLTPTDVLSGLGCEAEIPADTDERWQAFVAKREGWLHVLAEPIVDCVAQVDTNHPAFHGCIDWHSAVHGAYALHALYAMTGESSYLDAANAVLDPTGVAGELADIEGDDLPAIELLYGRAWFLLLARERELTTREQDLRPHAVLVADQIQAYLAGVSDQQLTDLLVADDYMAASWALLNLWRWAVHVDDQARIDWIEERVTTVAMVADCPLQNEVGFTADFFPPCLHRAMLVLTVLPADQTTDWLAAQLPPAGEFELEPLCMPSPAHTAGLNFSRAWGLWALWLASGETLYRDLYVEHVWLHVEQPAYWAENYQQHSHWIAQFGVHAIALSQ